MTLRGPAISYHRASSLADALRHLRRKGACAYAGGTDLMVALRHEAPWVSRVRHLVDVKGVREAWGILRTGSRLRIGALVTAAELASSATIQRTARVLSIAAARTSAPWLRARGTVGGNLVTPHPAGDVTTALLALGAQVEFVSSGQKRQRVPVVELLAAESTLPSGSLIVAVHVPIATSSAYERLARRQAFARASLAVAVATDRSGTRVALAGVAGRPALHGDVTLAPEIEDLVNAMIERAQRSAANTR